MSIFGGLGSDGIGFDHDALTEFTRLRPKRIVDPYDPDSTVVGSWDDADKLAVVGFLSSQSSSEVSDAVRAQAVTSKQLIFGDPGVDVQRGDRIRQGEKVWTVAGFPTADVNPFDGWQPTLVANLEEVVG